MSNSIKEDKLTYDSRVIVHNDNEVSEHNRTFEIEIHTHDVYVYKDILLTLRRINSGKDILFVEEFLNDYDDKVKRIKELEKENAILMNAISSE